MQWSLFGRLARAKVGLYRWWRQRQLWNVGRCIFAWPFAREDFIEYIHLAASPLYRTDSSISQSWRLEGTRCAIWIIKWLLGCASYNPCAWLACVAPLLNRFATNCCIIRPEGRLPDIIAYLVLGGQMNVVTLHAFGSVAAAIFKQALLHAKASQTNVQ
jgi:hypothetical protein